MAPSLMMTISKVPAPISSRAMNLTVIHGPAGVLHYFLGKKVELVVPPPTIPITVRVPISSAKML